MASHEGDSARARALRALADMANGLAIEMVKIAQWAERDNAAETHEDASEAIAQLRERLFALKRMIGNPHASDVADLLEQLITLALAASHVSDSTPPAGSTFGAPRGRLLIVTDDPTIKQTFELKLTPDYELSTERTHGDALRKIRARVPYRMIAIDLRVPGAVSVANAALSAVYQVACFPDDLPAELRDKVSAWTFPLRIEQVRGALRGSERRIRLLR